MPPKIQIKINDATKQQLTKMAEKVSAIVAPKQSKERAEELEAQLAKAEQAANALKTGLEEAKQRGHDLGDAMGLSGEKLDDFAKQYRQSFEIKNLQAYMDSLKEIQKLTWASKEGMNALSKQAGSDGDEMNFAKAEEKMRSELPFGERLKGDIKTGLPGLGAEKKFTEFWNKELPDSLGKASNAFGTLFSGIAFGTKTSQDAFAGLGKSIQQISQQVVTDLISVGTRAMFFGSSGTGGLFGTLISSFLHSGGKVGVDTPSFTRAIPAHLFASAPRLHGGGFFARDERPAVLLTGERVLNRRDTAVFDAAMRMSGGVQGQAAPPVNVNIHTPPGTTARTEQRQNQMGGWDMDVLIDFIDSSMAGGIASGRSRTAHALKMQGVG